MEPFVFVILKDNFSVSTMFLSETGNFRGVSCNTANIYIKPGSSFGDAVGRFDTYRSCGGRAVVAALVLTARSCIVSVSLAPQ